SSHIVVSNEWSSQSCSSAMSTQRVLGPVFERSRSPPADVSRCPKLCELTLDLFDHLIGAGKQRRRNGEAERLGGFEANYQLELRRLLHGQVTRLGTCQ